MAANNTSSQHMIISANNE